MIFHRLDPVRCLSPVGLYRRPCGCQGIVRQGIHYFADKLDTALRTNVFIRDTVYCSHARQELEPPCADPEHCGTPALVSVNPARPSSWNVTPWRYSTVQMMGHVAAQIVNARESERKSVLKLQQRWVTDQRNCSAKSSATNVVAMWCEMAWQHIWRESTRGSCARRAAVKG